MRIEFRLSSSVARQRSALHHSLLRVCIEHQSAARIVVNIVCVASFFRVGGLSFRFEQARGKYFVDTLEIMVVLLVYGLW